MHNSENDTLVPLSKSDLALLYQISQLIVIVIHL